MAYVGPTVLGLQQFIFFFRTECRDEFRNLSGCVLKILTACRILQISIARCQIEGEIYSFPSMYGKGGKLEKSRFPSKN